MKYKKNFIYSLIVYLFGIICCSGFSFLMPFRIYFIMLFGIIQFYLMVSDKKIKYVKSKSLLFLVLFCIFLLLSLFYSLDRVQTFKFIVMYMSILFMTINSYEEEFHINALNIIELFCRVIAISLLLNLLIPNLFSKYLYFFISGGRSAIPRLNGEVGAHIYSGILGEKGEAAYIMVVALILELSKFIPNINKKGIADTNLRKKSFIWLIIYLIALSLPAKRMLFVIGIMICVYFVLFWTKSRKKVSYIFIGLIVAIMGLLIATKVPALNTLVTRFSNYSEDKTGNGRIYLWERAEDMFNAKPLVGYGYGTYNSYTKFHGVLLSSTGEWNAYAHNIYYQMLGEIGIIGTIIFLLIILDTIICVIKLYIKKKEITNADLKLLFIGSSIIILNLIYGYSGNPIYYTNQAFVFFWGISIILYLKYKYRYKNKEEV